MLATLLEKLKTTLQIYIVKILVVHVRLVMAAFTLMTQTF